MTQPPDPSGPSGPSDPSGTPEPPEPSVCGATADFLSGRYAPGPPPRDTGGEQDGLPRPTAARWILAGVVLVAFAGLLAVRVTRFGGLDQTALFYVGLPALLALLVILCCRVRSAVGAAMAVTTLCLLLAGPLLGEGMVCLVIAAPLIYGVVALVTWIGTTVFRADRRHPNALVAIPILFALTMEGIGGFSLLPREDTGTGSVLIEAAPADVAAALAVPPEYGSPSSHFLRAVPFPEPVEAVGEGLETGDTRLVHFTPRRTLEFGAEPTPRHLELEIAESRVGADGGRVVFEVVEDTTFANGMEMERAVATWQSEGVGGASETPRLTWEIEYRRTYDPSWYFGPVQAYATDRAADYLAETFEATVWASAEAGDLEPPRTDTPLEEPEEGTGP